MTPGGFNIRKAAEDRRLDTMYCSNACRQAAYRERKQNRIEILAELEVEIGDIRKGNNNG